MRVAVVEDSPVDALVIESLLQEMGDHQITLLVDGEVAVEHVERNHVLPEVMFVDVRMPRLSGFEMMMRIGDKLRDASCNVVFLSSSGDEDDRQRAIALGASAFYTKPETLEEFRAMLRATVGR